MFDTLIQVLHINNASMWQVLFASFIWGIITAVINPTHLMSIPLLLAVTQNTQKEQKQSTAKTSRFLQSSWFWTCIFSLGLFLVVFIMGIAFWWVKSIVHTYVLYWFIFIGSVFIVLGIRVFLRMHCHTHGNYSRIIEKYGVFSAGVAFGFGSVGCTLASILPLFLLVAQFTQNASFSFLPFWVSALFAIGHVLPSVIIGGTALHVTQKFSFKHKKEWGTKILGGIFIIVGVFFYMEALHH